MGAHPASQSVPSRGLVRHQGQASHHAARVRAGIAPCPLVRGASAFALSLLHLPRHRRKRAGREEEARGAVRRVLELYPKFTIRRHMQRRPIQEGCRCRPVRRVPAPARPAGVKQRSRRQLAIQALVTAGDGQRMVGRHAYRAAVAGSAFGTLPPVSVRQVPGYSRPCHACVGPTTRRV